MEQYKPFENNEMTLLDLLDGVIETGVVVRGEIIISIANIDLIIIDLSLLISSIESAFGTNENNLLKEGGLVGTVTTESKQCRTGLGEIGSDSHRTPSTIDGKTGNEEGR